MNKLEQRVAFVRQRKEKGIVLISSLVFLILILGLLKLSLSGSQISNVKSGIDGDINLAQENAQLAIRSAEKEILDVIPMANISACASGANDCEEALKEAIAAAWILSTKSESCRQDFVNSGGCITLSYTGFTDNDRKAIIATINGSNSPIKDGNGMYSLSYVQQHCSNHPMWKCVNWGSYFGGDLVKNNGSSIVVGDLNDANSKIDIAPRYIIEWFVPGEIDMPSDGSVLFRITGVGFGQSGGSTEDVTYAIFQANYTL